MPDFNDSNLDFTDFTEGANFAPSVGIPDDVTGTYYLSKKLPVRPEDIKEDKNPINRAQMKIKIARLKNEIKDCYAYEIKLKNEKDKLEAKRQKSLSSLKLKKIKEIVSRIKEIDSLLGRNQNMINILQFNYRCYSLACGISDKEIKESGYADTQYTQKEPQTQQKIENLVSNANTQQEDIKSKIKSSLITVSSKLSRNKANMKEETFDKYYGIYSWIVQNMETPEFQSKLGTMQQALNQMSTEIDAMLKPNQKPPMPPQNKPKK